DTLFDTYGQLVRPASQESCAAMIAAGLGADLEECLETREKLLIRQPRADIYKLLVEEFGVAKDSDPRSVEAAGFNAFHDRKIKEEIKLFPDAVSTLSFLKKKFKMFLVTLGTPQTQMTKVEKLKLAAFFEEVFYVDVLREKSKMTALREILNKTR